MLLFPVPNHAQIQSIYQAVFSNSRKIGVGTRLNQLQSEASSSHLIN